MVIFCLFLNRFSLVFSNIFSALSLLRLLDFIVILCIDFELVSANSILLQNRPYGLFILLLQLHFTMHHFIITDIILRHNIQLKKYTVKMRRLYKGAYEMIWEYNYLIIYLFAYLIDSQAGGWKSSGRLFFCYGDRANDGWRRSCAEMALLIIWGAGIGANVARKGIKLTPKNDSKMPSRNRRMTAKWRHADRWSGERIWHSEREEKLHNLSKQTICAPCGTQMVMIWEHPSPCVSWQKWI